MNINTSNLSAVFAALCLTAGAIMPGSFVNAAPPPDKATTANSGDSAVPPGFLFRVKDTQGLERAREVQQRNADRYLERHGVHGHGISTDADGAVVIKFFLDPAASNGGIPQRIEGVPVIVERVAPAFALNMSCEEMGLEDCDEDTPDAFASASQPPNQRDWHPRPVPIGVSASHVDNNSGTIACRVSRGCHKFALSNAHVFANENSGLEGDHIIQPGTSDEGIDPDDVFATLYESVPIVMGTGGSVRNKVDAAIALTDETQLDNVTRTNGYGMPKAATVEPGLGMLVMKYGRSSAFSHGYIDAIGVTIIVGYKTGDARFVDQIVIRSVNTSDFSRSGDSGALILAESGVDDRKPVGLLFASTADKVYTIANPINEVLAALDVDIDGE